ncbi:unnamed protein product [Pieris macdunnoughi]|uniref:Uncharacterized protein n=1 Tax=Pieris macdunnoughi TaxID=345717 RepID=A0A821U8I0_9NEOP|nr:unnamed protein product [Pieris macdunnoughi]
MAGESSAISRNSSFDTLFIDSETEFVGKGNKTHVKNNRSRSGSRITSSLSVTDDTFYKDLEDYVKEMAGNTSVETDDVWRQLQQKESDLLLAAELGKALLEKNEELKKEQDKAAEDFSKKLEISGAVPNKVNIDGQAL